LFDDGWTAWLLESGERSGAEHGIDVRHPFFDRRIVEFAVAIPESQRWRDTTTKYVVRQALRDRLPPAVYSRAGKADGSMLVVWAVDAVGGRRALS
jgi:asparagine synthase (glutamine-hydrolysing)